MTTTTPTALHHTTSRSCGEVPTETIATAPKKHNFNHLSVHQWIRSAIRDSRQPTSQIGFLFLKLPPPPYAAPLALSYAILNKKHINQRNQYYTKQHKSTTTGNGPKQLKSDLNYRPIGFAALPSFNLLQLLESAAFLSPQWSEGTVPSSGSASPTMASS